MRGSRADRALPWITLAAALGLFELLARVGVLGDDFPPVTSMAAALWRELGRAPFWEAVGHTLEGWALGLALAVALAVPAGVAIGSSTLAWRALRVPIEFLRPIPSVALIPLAILVWGAGLESKVFLAAFAAFWIVLVQTLYGMQDVDPVATDTARSFGFSRAQRLARVALPSALPYVATGVRMASTVALILVITAELVIGAPGLGHSISVAQSGGDLELMYALTAVTGLLGWGLNSALAAGERRMLHWHPAQAT